MSENFLIKHYRVLYLLICLVSIILLVASHYWIPDNVFKMLAHELGVAGIVAVILVFTIETFTRERHRLAADDLLASINKNLFHAIYKRYIPEPVFEEVEKCVMRCSVYREAHELDYTIDDLPPTADEALRSSHFQCTAQTSYKLSNLLDQDTTHDITIKIERPLESKYDALCTINELTVNGVTVPESELMACITRTDQHVVLCKKIELPARGKVDVSTKSTLLKKKTDSEIWCSRLPSDGLKLTVSTPSKGLMVKASANHSERLKVQLDNQVTRKWVLDFGIFPHQSIIFWWQQA